MKPADVPCPWCGAAAGCLSIEEKLVTAPLGTYSIGGSQLKVTAATMPVLSCSECGGWLAGRYDADGKHILFRAPAVKEHGVPPEVDEGE